MQQDSAPRSPGPAGPSRDQRPRRSIGRNPARPERPWGVWSYRSPGLLPPAPGSSWPSCCSSASHLELSSAFKYENPSWAIPEPRQKITLANYTEIKSASAPCTGPCCLQRLSGKTTRSHTQSTASTVPVREIERKFPPSLVAANGCSYPELGPPCADGSGARGLPPANQPAPIPRFSVSLRNT